MYNIDVSMEKNIGMVECDKEKSYKDKVLEWVCSNAEKLKWVRDESSNCLDCECKIEDGLTLRVVSSQESQYLQVLRSYRDFRIYDAKDYPEINDILQIAYKQWCVERDKHDEKFFEDIFKRLGKAVR